MKTETFDKKLKQKLETRRISPSASGWGKLENRLEQGKKTKKPIWAFGIAAVFLVGFFLGGLVFKPGKKAANNPQLVNETPEKQMEKTPGELERPLTVPVRKNKTPAVATTSGEGEEKKSTPEFSAEPSTTTTDKFPQKSKMAVSEIPSEKSLKEKADEIVRGLTKKTELSGITDAEIEKLLMEAQLEIAAQNDSFEISENPTISAQSLLESVEKELRPTYREKLFKLVEDKLSQLAAANNPFQ